MIEDSSLSHFLLYNIDTNTTKDDTIANTVKDDTIAKANANTTIAKANMELEKAGFGCTVFTSMQNRRTIHFVQLSKFMTPLAHILLGIILIYKTQTCSIFSRWRSSCFSYCAGNY